MLGVVQEHFRHIKGFDEIYWLLPMQFGHYTLKKFLVSIYIVFIVKKP
jgi:hypothetical protein